MIQKKLQVFPLLMMSFLIIIGNTAFPCMLRLIIWILSKFTRPWRVNFERIQMIKRSIHGKAVLPMIIKNDIISRDIVRADGIGRPWWGIFTSASAFNDLGFTLTPDSNRLG
jgi:Trk-type K+ transport system membrane component